MELSDISVVIDEKSYEVVPLNNGFYRVDIPDLRKPGIYSVNVYSNGQPIAENLSLIVKREGQREKDLL